MSKKIIWTATATRNLKEIFAYWNQRNKSKNYSRKLNRFFKGTLALIALAPLTGLTTEMKGVRVKRVRDYWVFYTYTEHEIYVLQIRSTYENPDSYFLNL